MSSHPYKRFYLPGHPVADKHGIVAEHRIVAYQLLGRPLKPNEDVHHINGDPSDNRCENILILSHGEHSRLSGLRPDRTCAVCSGKYLAKGLCARHYSQELRRRQAEKRGYVYTHPPVLILNPCPRCGMKLRHKAKGLCSKCYGAQWKRRKRAAGDAT